MKVRPRLNPVAQAIQAQRMACGRRPAKVATLAVVGLGMSLGLGTVWAQAADAPATGTLLAAEGGDIALEGSVTSLPTVTVEAQAPSTYRSERASSPKYTEPLRDTPQTVQVITSELFTQQGASTLTEALRNSPAVGTFYVGENGSTNTGDAIYMRGFDTSNSIFVDGIRDAGSVSRDVFNIDAVEVVKGPAGTDSGRGAPTGSINMVTKQALLENAISGTVSAGTDNQKRVTADLNQTLNGVPGAALRLNAMWQDSDVPGRDHVNNSRSGIAPALAFGLGTATRAYVNLLYVRQDNIPDGGVPTIALPGWTPQTAGAAGTTDQTPLIGHPVDPNNFYGTRDDHDDATSQMATARVEHDFSDTLKLSNITRWGQTSENYLLTSYLGTNANIQTSNPGDPDDLSSYTIARSNPNVKDQQNKILTDQLNLRYDFVTGSVRHSLSSGAELTREDLYSHGITVSGSRPAANLYNPDYDDIGTLSLSRNGSGAHGRTNTVALYAFDTLKFGEHFLLSGGLRVDRYKTDYQSSSICNDLTPGTRGAVACNGAPVGSVVQTIDATSKGTLFNWKLGAVYKPVQAGSLYANYAVSQQPPGGANFTLSASSTSLDNPNLDPEKAKTYELGTKWDLFHEALSVNLALFRTEVSNEINTTVTPPTQDGKKRVQGVELSAVGSITKNWAVSAGYTHQSTKVVKGAPTAQDGSENLTYTPGDAFTSWTTYRLPLGFTLGGGVRYSGRMHRGTDGAAGTPTFTQSYTVYDAVAEYEVNKHFTLRANAYNLFDKEYVAAINKSGYRYTPGSPRTFLFSGDFRF